MSEAIGAGTDAAAVVWSGPQERVVGPVLRAPGFAAGPRLPSRREAEVAAALRDHRAEFDAYLASGAVGAPPPACGLAGADLAVLQSGDFHQIWVDFRTLLSDDPKGPVSPTLRFTLDRAGVGEGSRVLEIGGSAGRHLLHLAERRPRVLANLDYNLLPLVLGATAWEAQGIAQPMVWVWGDALSLPFRDGAFTNVNTFVTLSLLPVRRSLREIRRVLEPGGRLTMTIEGIGYWLRNWRATRGFGRSRLGRLREWVAYRAMRAGFDWQEAPGLGRLAGHTAFDPATISRIVGGEGFDVEGCEVLIEEEGRPRLIGLTATKRPDAR